MTKKFLESLGSVSAIIGAQWGDEGKGKVTDLLAEHFDVIARATGGANAGHTIIVQGKKHVFHLLPSGSLREGKNIVLGAGLVIHLPTLLEEIRLLQSAGIDVVPRLFVSSEAHIVFDYHKAIDAALEEGRSKSTGAELGTTKRGIGPAYMEKAERSGIRVGQIFGDISEHLKQRAETLHQRFGVDIDIPKECAQVKEAADVLQGRVGDIIDLLQQWLSDGKKILVEGAQATLLDIDHGTYPHVTSSATTAAGALQGLGLPPNVLTSCIGVAKAYCTRVGGGIFKTEAQQLVGDRLRERGGEYGATTGRPRRCGWLHLADLRRSVAINGFTHWNITKLDVLDEEQVIPIGFQEDKVKGTITYEELPGWLTSTVGMTSWKDLPQNAQDYLNFIEQETGVKVSLIGTGPEREQMIVR